MISSLCIRCGTPKERYDFACDACGFTPSTSEDLAKSLVLSKQIQEIELVGEPTKSPPNDNDLSMLSEAIKAGKTDIYDRSLLMSAKNAIEGATSFAKSLTWTKLIFVYGLPVVLIWGVLIWAFIKIIR